MKDNVRPDPKQVARQWGLPDWLDGSQYPDHQTFTIVQWCWQFLRRSPEYREFWCDEVLPVLKTYASLAQRVEFAVAGKMDAQEKEALHADLLNMPFDTIPFWQRLSGGSSTPVESIPQGWPPGGREMIGWQEAGRRFELMYALDPRSNERAIFAQSVKGLRGRLPIEGDPYKLVVELDVRLPDKYQLDQVKNRLQARREVLKRRGMTEIHTLEARAHVVKYANYLRVLDAKSSGASDRTIAKVLFTNRGIPAGLKRVENCFNAARELRDGGWRRLLTTVDVTYPK